MREQRRGGCVASIVPILCSAQVTEVPPKSDTHRRSSPRSFYPRKSSASRADGYPSSSSPVVTSRSEWWRLTRTLFHWSKTWPKHMGGRFNPSYKTWMCPTGAPTRSVSDCGNMPSNWKLPSVTLAPVRREIALPPLPIRRWLLAPVPLTVHALPRQRRRTRSPPRLAPYWPFHQ